MSLIADTLLAYLPPKKKHTPSGWISFNAVCCHHNGTSADTRQRGGFIVNGSDAVSYHCFNCGFKASWQPGRLLTPKMKKLMQWLNVPDDDIGKMALDALRLKEDIDGGSTEQLVPTFTQRALPKDARSFEDWSNWYKLNPDSDLPENFIKAVEYVSSRRIGVYDYPFYWTKQKGFDNRLIIPFVYRNQIVGWTARSLTDAKPKYISEQQPGYVFNLDRQHWDRKFVIVCEGPFDAMSIDGVALLGSDIHAGQHILINQLRREVIVVPDRDPDGKKTTEQAIALGWSVSMPEWPEGVKDINDAVKILGKPATLWLIITQRLQTELKIRLRMKQYFNDNNN
jgi:hypothetical protein